MPDIEPDISQFWFVQHADLKTRLSMDYHEHSKNSEFLFGFGMEDPKRTAPMIRLINAVAGKNKNYSFCPSIPLEPAAWNALDQPLGDVLRNRRTRRQFVPRELPIADVATLLVRGAGVNGEIELGQDKTQPVRTYPSGGGLFPLEIYFIALDVEKIPRGVFFFDVYEPSLRLLREGNFRKETLAGFMESDMAKTCGGVVLVTALFKRSAFKYGERSYRFIMQEAGHLMQNLILVAQAQGLSVVPMGGFFDRQFEQLIEVDGVEESVIYAGIVGTPK